MSIQSGQSSTLSWNVANPNSVSIDNGIGAVSASGTRSVSPGSTTTYTLTASNSSGTVTAGATVTVASAPAPTITQFSADSTSLQAGQSTTLRWTVSNATTVSIDNGIGTVSSSSTRAITPGSTTIYTLIASSAGGTRTQAVTVTVTSAATCTVAPRGGSPIWNSDLAQYTGDLSNGQSNFQPFTLTTQTRVTLKSVSDYSNQTAIITPDQVSNFKNGASYLGWAVFDGTYGSNPVTLAPGDYYAAARYFGAGSTHIRFEVDGTLQVPGASFVDYYLDKATPVSPNGGIVWQPFTIQCGGRYFLDGLNNGTEFYLIPASELNNVKNGLPFLRYESYSGPAGGIDEDQPDDYELLLPPGDYDLVYINRSTITKYVVFVMSRWQ